MCVYPTSRKPRVSRPREAHQRKSAQQELKDKVGEYFPAQIQVYTENNNCKIGSTVSSAKETKQGNKKRPETDLKFSYSRLAAKATTQRALARQLMS